MGGSFLLCTAEVGSIKPVLELELRGWRDTELPPPLHTDNGTVLS